MLCPRFYLTEEGMFAPESSDVALPMMFVLWLLGCLSKSRLIAIAAAADAPAAAVVAAAAAVPAMAATVVVFL